MNKQGKRNKNKNKAKQGGKKDDASSGSWEEMLNKPLPEAVAAVASGEKEDDWEEDNDATAATANTCTPNPEGDETAEGGEGEDQANPAKKKRKKRINKNAIAKLKEARKSFIDRCVSPSFRRTSKLQLNGEISLVNHKKMKDEPDAVYKNTRSGANKANKGSPGIKDAPVKPSADAGDLISADMADPNYGGFGTGIPPTMNADTNEWSHPGMAPYNEVVEEKKHKNDSSEPGSCSGESSEDEDLTDYHADGYHPVHIK